MVAAGRSGLVVGRRRIVKLIAYAIGIREAAGLMRVHRRSVRLLPLA